jgi:phosphate transport system permease protein
MNLRRVLKAGDPWIWLTGGSVAVSLLMIAGLLVLVTTKSLGFFWPADLLELTLKDGTKVLGQVRNREAVPASSATPATLERTQLQVGNRDLYGADFRWIDADQVAESSYPDDAVCLERLEWGNFYGFVQEVWSGETPVASGPQAGWTALRERLPAAQALAEEMRELETSEFSDVNYALDQERLHRARAVRAGAGPDVLRAIEEREAELRRRHDELQRKLAELSAKTGIDRVVMRDAGGQEKEIALSQIVYAYRPNAMSAFDKSLLYASKLWEFVSDDPRESNTEGGIFPAIFGTVMMVMLMSVAVVPFGVLAALYLREYARDGVLVRIVRIAVNNLAGVPSIVFGVFGLGFFVYFVGGSIDALFFSERAPMPTFGTGGILWAALTLALLTVPVVVVATEEALAAVPKEHREGSLALGATKFETIWRVVLPSALPGVLTGLILAMARGAGEVAPLMITGVVKLAPSLPFDGNWPFFHLDRKFMHLGFHIYDVGFQSPNVEAAKPMVFATTLLLVLIIVSLNLSAILLRNRLRRRLSGGTF